MRLLLDTRVFLLSTMASSKLGKPARDLMESADEVWVSAASIWEVTIKLALGRVDGDIDEAVKSIEASGFRNLPVSAQHAAAVRRLPAYHSDPFDRLLIAQAITEPLHLLTLDPLLQRYSELVIVVPS